MSCGVGCRRGSDPAAAAPLGPLAREIPDAMGAAQKKKKKKKEWLLSKRQEIMSAGKDGEKRDPSYTAGGNINWRSHYGKLYGGSSKRE